MITGLILAAGESIRMKSPKALLYIGGVTFAEHIASLMKSGKVDPVFVIAGAHIEEIQGKFAKCDDFSIIHNPRYMRGQISSLKEGLRQLPTGARAVMVWPVDQPLVKLETVRQLVAAFESEGKPVVIPTHQGKHGHPVLYGLPAIQSILNLKKNQTGKDVRAMYQDQTAFVEADDPGVLIDIDTQEDYKEHIE